MRFCIYFIHLFNKCLLSTVLLLLCSGGRVGLFQATFHPGGKPWQELKAKSLRQVCLLIYTALPPNKELTSQPVPWRMLSYAQLTSYTVQDHLSRDGTAYGGPGPTKLITNQNNSPTDFLTNQSNLGNSSVGTLFSGSDKLTVQAGQLQNSSPQTIFFKES